jgi:hypothetical protein
MFCPSGSCSGVFGLSLEDLTGTARANELLAGEKSVLVQFKDPEPKLLPRNEFLKGLIETVFRDLEPTVMVETLHVYEKPSSAEKSAWNADERAGLFNSLLALSSLAGLQYFSASRGTMRTFYEASQVIDGPSTKKPLTDPVYPQPPAELTIYARQQDTTFGDNIYQYDFYSAPEGFVSVQQNLTSLSAGIIPAVGKNKLRSVVAVLDAGNHILVYAASMTKAVSIPGMKERVGNSFANRAEAVFNWFSDQADKAYKTLWALKIP